MGHGANRQRVLGVQSVEVTIGGADREEGDRKTLAARSPVCDLERRRQVVGVAFRSASLSGVARICSTNHSRPANDDPSSLREAR